MDTKKDLKSYEDLYINRPDEFLLMKNSSNALLLQFKDNLKYDLKIPRFGHIKTLAHMFYDSLGGMHFNPEKVDCMTGINYASWPIRAGINLDLPSNFKQGMRLCFNKKNKYDEAPLETHLNWNEDLFGYEKGFYRFREGKRKETEKQVRDYFDTENLRAFKEFGEFVKPYVNKLDRPHTINF